MFLKEGTALEGGKYRIIKVLGHGGFGITYLAMNTILEMKVAIKEFFPKDFCDRDDFSRVTLGTTNTKETIEKLKARFIKEAKNLSRLHYEGIVGIRDVFEENDTAYYVMDYIEGSTLTEIVKRNGPLDEKTAVRYIEEVGKSLEYIHSKHMTHFDVKPSNIMISSETGRPVLIDFGLSKQYDIEGQATSSMLQGVSQGFSALEMYNPGTLNNFSPKTDIYSLAATLYYLLTATVPPVATQLVEEGLSMPSGISPHIREAIRKAMSSTRGNRHESVKEFCRSIAGASYRPQTAQDVETTKIMGAPKQEVISKEPEPKAKIDKPAKKKRNTGWIVAIILFILIIIGVALLFIFKDTGSNKKSRHDGYTEQEASAMEKEGVYDAYIAMIDTIADAVSANGILDYTLGSTPAEVFYGKNPVDFRYKNYWYTIQENIFPGRIIGELSGMFSEDITRFNGNEYIWNSESRLSQIGIEGEIRGVEWGEKGNKTLAKALEAKGYIIEKVGYQDDTYVIILRNGNTSIVLWGLTNGFKLGMLDLSSQNNRDMFEAAKETLSVYPQRNIKEDHSEPRDTTGDADSNAYMDSLDYVDYIDSIEWTTDATTEWVPNATAE